MTMRELSKLYYLRKEIALYEERLAELRCLAESAPGSKLQGIPGGGGPQGSRLDRYIPEIVELEETLLEHYRRCVRERLRLERCIAEIPDSLTRLIFSKRFVDGLSWSGVAHGIRGISPDAARMICRRYLQNAKERDA